MSSLSDLLDEAIAIEYNTAELYSLYSECFPKDREFWKGLSREETIHGQLIDSAKRYIPELSVVVIDNNYEMMKLVNDSVRENIDEYRRMLKNGKKINRFDAYFFAVSLEDSSQEEHYHNMIVGNYDQIIIDIFRELNGGDIDHKKRIYENYVRGKE